MNVQIPPTMETHPIHPNLFRLTVHFGTRSDRRAVPLLQHFDPEELHWLFGCFYTVRVLDGAADYRFSYCGSCWQSFYGFDPTGKRLSELEAAGFLPMQGRRVEFDAVVAAKRSYYTQGLLDWPRGDSVRFDRLIIPFADKFGRIVMLLVAAQGGENMPELIRHKMQGQPHVRNTDTFWPALIQSASQSLRTPSREE